MIDDLISRQGAIDAFTCKGSIFTYGANECKTIVSRIMALPSAQPEQRWVPCSERLPEVKQAVLVTTKNGQRDIRKCIDGGHLTWFYNDTIAWMPLPEPYQKRGEQDGNSDT